MVGLLVQVFVEENEMEMEIGMDHRQEFEEDGVATPTDRHCRGPLSQRCRLEDKSMAARWWQKSTTTTTADD